LPALEGRLTDGILNLLDPPIGDTLEKFPARHLAPRDEKERKIEPGEGYAPREHQEHEPAYKKPSEMESEGEPGESETIGAGFDKRGEPNPGHLGDAIHGFFAAAERDGLEDSVRRSIAAGLLSRYEVAGALDPDDLLKAGDAFKNWVNRKWPGAKWHREMPMMYRLDKSIVRGFCDLALQTEGGWVVIDHKSHPTAEKAAGHAGQLKAYAEGIEKATGKQVLGCWIHLPLVGAVVPVNRTAI
jgi:hypothetical protein